MNVQEYRQAREAVQREPRGLCSSCRHPPLTCYCRSIRRFDPKIRFVILIHVREAQKRIATGRLAHLNLEGSLLIEGYDYSNDSRVNTILADKQCHPVILYPGPQAQNLSTQSVAARRAIFPHDKEPVVFVIDGTWITARKTLQRSANLQGLPQICFEPERPSRFRVRKQPKPNFFSTIEAIHQSIELLGPAVGFDLAPRTHDTLLQAFDGMVERQIELAAQPKRYCLWKPKKNF